MLRILYIEMWRFFRSLVRYRLELLGSILSAIVVLGLFFLGVRYLAGPAVLGDRLEALVIGLLAWTLSFSLISNAASTLTEESLTGLTEQLAMTRPGLLGLVLIRALVSTVQIGLLNIPVILAVLVFSGVRLNVVSACLPPLFTLLLGSAGLGLAMGALTLIYKRVGQLLNLAQFVVLGLFLPRFEQLSRPWDGLALFLPLTPSVSALRLSLGQGAEPAIGLLLAGSLNALAYLALGMWLFRRSFRTARRHGLLGVY